MSLSTHTCKACTSRHGQTCRYSHAKLCYIKVPWLPANLRASDRNDCTWKTSAAGMSCIRQLQVAGIRSRNTDFTDPPKRYMKETGVAWMPDGCCQSEQWCQVGTIQPVVKNMVQEKKIGLDESCLDGWHAEMREKLIGVGDLKVDWSGWSNTLICAWKQYLDQILYIASFKGPVYIERKPLYIKFLLENKEK